MHPEWADLDREPLKHFEECSEHGGILLSCFGRAGQCKAALWTMSLVLGGASSLFGAQHAVGCCTLALPRRDPESNHVRNGRSQQRDPHVLMREINLLYELVSPALWAGVN